MKVKVLNAFLLQQVLNKKFRNHIGTYLLKKFNFGAPKLL